MDGSTATVAVVDLLRLGSFFFHNEMPVDGASIFPIQSYIRCRCQAACGDLPGVDDLQWHNAAPLPTQTAMGFQLNTTTAHAR